MIATALENSGAIVYIVSRRLQALEAAVSTSSVSLSCSVSIFPGYNLSYPWISRSGMGI